MSKIVSTRITWQPPSTIPFTCSLYAATISSHVMLRKPGSSTDGEIESVRFVGPTAPATIRGFSGCFAVTSAAALTASSHATRLSS